MAKYYYSDLSQISPSTDDPILCVRICRRWLTIGSDILPESLHVVMKDDKGVIIQGSISKALIKTFSKELQEGRIYNLRNFDVVPKPPSSTVSNHSFVIVFRDDTFVRESNNNFFPPSIFGFATFPELKRRSKFAKGHLFDVIGRVVDVNDRMDKQPVIHLMLQDLRKNLMHCLIYEPHHSKLAKFVISLRANVLIPKFVILQLCRKSIYQGQVCVSTAFDVSDLIVDQSHPEILDYKNSMQVSNKTFHIDGAMFPDQSLTSSSKELVKQDCIVYDYGDVWCCQDVLNLWTIGLITDIHEDRGWYYTYCVNCSAIDDCSGSEIFCPTCGEKIIHTARYKIHLSVIDVCGYEANLILINELATSLIQTSVHSFLNSYYKGRVKPEFPYQVVLALIGREMFFKVKVEDHHVETLRPREYVVDKCSQHPRLLKFHKDKLLYHQPDLEFGSKCSPSVFEIQSSDDIHEDYSDETETSSDSDT